MRNNFLKKEAKNLLTRNLSGGIVWCVRCTKRYNNEGRAKHLGMTEKTFYTKMKKGVFDSDEMAEMITYLGIDNPYEIFFASLGAHCAPSEKRG